MAEGMSGLNLVLLGKTGAGKSASGNTILGRDAFVSKKSSRSVSQDVAVDSETVCGFSISVYDTPGLCDTEQSEEVIRQRYQSVFQRCESDLCAFLLVIKSARFTAEEKETVEKIEELLGEERLEKTWILFTRGDELEEEKMTIDEFINDNQLLKKLIQNYQGRYHVFNNTAKKHTAQVKTLLEKIFGTILHRMVKGAREPKQSSLRQKLKATLAVSSPSSRRIVLLGKTGVGKSAVGNTILGQREFRSAMRMNSVTHECSDAHATVSGRSVSVVDTPGLFDTKMKPEELMREIAESVYISSPGPHAFLIVFRVDDRFTEQEQQIPQMIEMMFGDGVLKYSIILFTHGDQIEGEPIENDIQESQALRYLVDQCGGRYHVFNNKDVNNRDQVNDLLKKIDTMIEQNGGGHYSNQMYEDAERLRREKEERRQRDEEEQRKQEEERRRQEEIWRVRLETELRVRAEIKAERRRQTCVCS